MSSLSIFLSLSHTLYPDGCSDPGIGNVTTISTIGDWFRCDTFAKEELLTSAIIQCGQPSCHISFSLVGSSMMLILVEQFAYGLNTFLAMTEDNC